MKKLINTLSYWKQRICTGCNGTGKQGVSTISDGYTCTAGCGGSGLRYDLKT